MERPPNLSVGDDRRTLVGGRTVERFDALRFAFDGHRRRRLAPLFAFQNRAQRPLLERNGSSELKKKHSQLATRRHQEAPLYVTITD